MPEETAAIQPGLDLFAAAWLERWQSFGGVVFVDLVTGKPSTMMPKPGVGGRPDIEGEGYAREWKDGYETGRWRELDDLLRLVPGGTEALAAHVMRYPNRFSESHVST
jgi:hypothetical protein